MDKLDLILEQMSAMRQDSRDIRLEVFRMHRTLMAKPCGANATRISAIEEELSNHGDFRKWAIGLIVTIILAAIGWAFTAPEPVHGGTDVGVTCLRDAGV